MARVLVVSGSVRPKSVNEVVLNDVTKRLRAQEKHEIVVADLGSLDLPFFDADMPPSAPEYQIPHQSVRKWSEMVTESDGVLLVMPEYNAAMTAVQKNAIDWLYSEWKDKPIAVVTYGFHEGRRAMANFEMINSNIHAKLLEPVAQLQFMRELSPAGEIVDTNAYDAIVQPTLDALLDEIS